MKGRLHEERGMTLIEVLLASILSLLVMGASLAAFDGLQGNHKLTQKTNEAQDVARQQTDRFARELRNLASPSQLTDDLSAQPQAVDVAGDYDFVFRVVNDVRPAGSLNAANVKRVRYCLNTANPANAVVWRQTQTWTTAATPALPSTAACPGTGWDAGSDVQYIGNVVNRYNGQDRPIFIYNSTDILRVSKVRTSLYIDLDPTKRPAETRLSSGVFLRNQNRVPVADFTATVTADKRLILNGSGSEDPAGMPLKYQWYVDAPTPLPSCSTPAPASCLGEGVVFEKTGLSGGGQHTITLVVKDPAELGGTATQTVTYPN